MTKQTKIQLLIALLLIWGGTVVFQYLDEAENSSPSGINEDSAQRLSSTDSKFLVLSKSFDNPRQHVTLSTPRNIFSPFNLLPPKPRTPSGVRSRKKKLSPPPTPTIQPQVVVPPGPSPIELATQRAQQQLRQFRFLGYLKKGGESQAFLTKGQSIYIVKQGATVEGRILVNRIDPTLIVLSTRILESGDVVQEEIPLTKDSQRS